MIRADTCTTTELQPRRQQINELHRGFQSICNSIDGVDGFEGFHGINRGINRGSKAVRTDLQRLVRSIRIDSSQIHPDDFRLDKILINLRTMGSREVVIVESDLGDNGSVITDIIESYISRNCSRTCSVKSISRACSIRTGSVSSQSITSDGDPEGEVVFLDKNCHMGNRNKSFLDLIDTSE